MAWNLKRIVATATVALTLMAESAAHAQSYIYFEDFENMGNVPIGGYGPQGLINEGWTFVNNSQPLGPIGWVSGCCWGGIIDPLSGSGYLATYQDSSGGQGSQYSNWAILPAISGQQTGDIFTFYSISSDTAWWESVHLEVRYSPSGGINVGTTPQSVGDFTNVLLTISPMPNYNQGLYDGWTKWEVTLPGPGRIAFRQFGTESMYFGIEDASVSHPTGPQPPMPEAFEDLDGVCGEGPCRLINEQGWTFADQGALNGGPAWAPANPLGEFTAHSGVSFITSSKGGASGSINTWAILPAIGNQAGDELNFVVRGDLNADAVFEVRYSPSGGTSTGSGPSGVGDFTQVLLQLTTLPYDAWQAASAAIPGPGRIALRLHDPFQSQFDYVSIVAVDTMDINGTPSGPPLPGPGETVTWTLADSPIEITTDLFIPPGGTVIVEPGVQINVAEEATLSIGGTVQGDGTAAQPIMIDSEANFPPGISVTNGTLDLAFADINTNILPNYHSTLLFDHCTFAGPNAYIFNSSLLITENDQAPGFISIDHCTFANGNIIPSDHTLRLTNSTFINGASALPLRGYVYVDNLDIDGGSLSISRDQQDVYINNITVQNSPGPAISVGGSNVGNDYLFGPDNVLENNQYPVSVSAGILPGSVLPQKGNIIDAVLMKPIGFEIFGPVTWADPGIPYHVDQSPFLVGQFRLLPGVTMMFQPGHGFAETSGFESRGLPGNPVTFQPLSGMWYGIFTPQRMEYSVVDGSQWGIINDALGLPGFFDSSVFQNNERAMVGHAYVRKSQFLNNVIGANVSGPTDLNGQTNPNWFEGNSLAVYDASDARYNWWGHPTGPSGPQNPGGQGDPVNGGVPVHPFRTTPPDLSNHPPIINMQELYFVAAPSSTVILHWSTIDADIASHRVLVSTESDVPDQYAVVAKDLPASQRSYALTLPAENGFFGAIHIRVEGIDSLGQIGWDHKAISVKPISHDPSIVLPLPKGETQYTLGHPVPVDESISFFNIGWVLLDGQLRYESFGAWGVLPTVVTASTDTVRFAMTDYDTWTFSDWFVVRPDERIGDAPPAVTLLSPQSGAFTGGSIVNVSWTASDDEGIRYATVQASYDGGLTFHDVARRLPASNGAGSFNWQLPPLVNAIADVRVRIVVEDLRFQKSSDTGGQIALTPGTGGIPGDVNGDALVNIDDLFAVIAAWGACPPPPPPASCPTDLDGDGDTDIDDLFTVIANWS